jgi:diguanylate cyclase (GGDEF)-like protein
VGAAVTMNRGWSWARVAGLLALLVAYTAAGKLGLHWGIVNPSASPIWAPTGIALAAFVLYGGQVWPAIFLGAFLYNFTTAGSLVTSFGVALGNTIEAAVGANLVRRWANGPHAFEVGRDVVRFVVLAGILATTVSPSVGVTTLALGGYVKWTDYATVWVTWWLGDTSGALLLAPTLILWGMRRHVHWASVRMVEIVALFTALVLLSALAFGPLGGPSLGFLCLPVLVWSAMRFGPRLTSTAVTVVSIVGVVQTASRLDGLDPGQRNAQLLLLQVFMAVTAITILVLAGVVNERRRGEAQLHELAITDPLTGLANYRQMITILEWEMKRYLRSGRPFSLLFFDLDGLKVINDRLGHLVGSRALCRIADALRSTCRAVDTPARYGGDEFALVLPETDEPEALRVAQRACAQLAADAEQPPLSASVGVAVFPRDGDSVERLIGTADRALYAMKQSRG